jgi:hypothetical protein
MVPTIIEPYNVIIEPYIKAESNPFNQGQHCQDPYNPACTPSPLLRRKISSPLLPMVSPHVILPPELVLASLLCLESFRNSFLTSRFLLLVILPNSPPLINDQSSPKSPLGRLPMLSRPPNTLTPSFPIPSPHKQLEMCSSRTH